MASTAEEGITIIFHKKIDVHDITAVEVNDTDEFIHWLKNYIMRYRLELPEKLNSALPIIEDYVNRGYNYFVIDIIELEEDLASVEPIVYKFKSNHIYFPLKVSKVAKGSTFVTLFIVTTESQY